MSGVLIDLPLRFKVYALMEGGQWILKAAFEVDQLAGAWALGVMSHGVQVRVFEDAAEITQQIVAKTAEALKDDPAVQEMLKKLDKPI